MKTVSFPVEHTVEKRFHAGVIFAHFKSKNVLFISDIFEYMGRSRRGRDPIVIGFLLKL
jgi:hypothetical protein